VIHTELSAYLQLNNVKPVELSRFLGVTRNTVFYWTSGRSPIPRYVHIVLSLLPEEDVHYFVTGGLELLQFEPWQTLGVSPSATIEEVRNARKGLGLKYHSDVGGCDRIMGRVNAAMDKIVDAKR
jgi:hypothetical protein